jgi:hypothetical protein
VGDEDPLAGIIEHDTAGQEIVDAAGEILDPVVHLVTDSGKPVFNADDTFRKRPQRGKNAEPATASEAASEAAGESETDPAPTEPDPEQQAADEADAQRGAGGEEPPPPEPDDGISME